MTDPTPDTPAARRALVRSAMSRRTYLALVAAGITTVNGTSVAAASSPTASAPTATQAASTAGAATLSVHGYGDGGYGDMPYGGGNPNDPAVTTDAASNVSDTGATLNGTLTDLAGESSADVYFEYRETGSSSWTATSAQTLSATGSFDETVSGLSAGTDYEYRSVAETSGSVVDTGSTVTFATTGGGGGNWWDPYTDSDEIASSAGQHVLPAIDDFENTGSPDAGKILTLIESFETLTPVPDLINN